VFEEVPAPLVVTFGVCVEVLGASPGNSECLRINQRGRGDRRGRA
jgi:hypothetical protein